ALLGGAGRPRRRQLAHHPLQRAEVGRATPHGHHRLRRRTSAPRHEARPRRRLPLLHAHRRAHALGSCPGRARAQPPGPRRGRRDRPGARHEDGMTDIQPSPSGTPDDRSTTFQAVEGNAKEQYSGGALLVTAYAALWVVLFAWVALVWRKQGAISARLADLERVIDKADQAATRAEVTVDTK